MKLNLLLVAAVAFVPSVLHAAELKSINECAIIKDGAKRLACFDAAMKREASQPTPPSEPVIQVPLDIKGAKIGMAEAEMRAKFQNSECMPGGCSRSRIYRKGTSEFDSFAGASVDRARARFNEGLVVYFTVRLSADKTHIVFPALIEKYGSGVRRESEFKTKGGLSTTQITSRWTLGDTELVAQSPDGSIDEMSVTLYSKSFLDKNDKEVKAKAAGDL